MINILSIDLEDWYQLAHRRVTGELLPARDAVLHQLDVILEMLAETSTRATFFTLAMVAEQYPEVVKRVAAAGHEIACHGYRHLIVHRCGRAEFEEDTRKAKTILENLSGKPVLGYRAAEFSIRRNALWALEVLSELGFVYDSSIFPIRHRRYGISDFDPRPSRHELPGGLSLIELPPSMLPMAGLRLPVAGGGYFRLLPLSALRQAVQRLNAEGRPLVTYLHPAEFDPENLDVMWSLRPKTKRQRWRAHIFNFHQNLRRRTMREKVSMLLREFQFSSCQEYLDAAGLDPGRGLLSAHRG